MWRYLCSLGRRLLDGPTELWRLNEECAVRRADNVRLRDERDRAIADRNRLQHQLDELTARHALLLDADAGVLTIPDTIPQEWNP